MSLRLIIKYFYHSIWLAGGCAAIQSEVRFETSCNLRSILTWKFISIRVTGVSLKTDTCDVHYLEVVIMNDTWDVDYLEIVIEIDIWEHLLRNSN